ncbi:head GIN domain-containing protein [Oxalobacteraceae bacterium A2-2]
MTPSPTLRSALRALFLAAGMLAVAAPAGMALAASPLGWLSGGERIQGSGKIVQQTRQLGHFSGLATSVSGDIEVRTGSTESITIETDDNILPQLETVVENGTLRIRPVKRKLQLDTRRMKMVLQVRSLDHISVAGSGSVNADQLRGDHVQLDIGGSGNINLRQLEGQSVAVAVGGSGDLRVNGGKAERLQVSIGGSGEVQAGKLGAREVSVSIGGSGQATVWATQALSVSVAGSGDVEYYGDPQVSKNVMGSGSVKRLAGAPR